MERSGKGLPIYSAVYRLINWKYRTLWARLRERILPYNVRTANAASWEPSLTRHDCHLLSGRETKSGLAILGVDSLRNWSALGVDSASRTSLFARGTNVDLHSVPHTTCGRSLSLNYCLTRPPRRLRPHGALVAQAAAPSACSRILFNESENAGHVPGCR